MGASFQRNSSYNCLGDIPKNKEFNQSEKAGIYESTSYTSDCVKIRKKQSGMVYTAVNFQDFLSQSDMNQNILRFEISKVLVGKGKGKLILRLYTS